MTANQPQTKTHTINTKSTHDAIPVTEATPQQVVITELRILRLKEVADKLGIGKSTIYDWLNKKSPRYDETFPKPIKLSSKSIGWLSTEIDAWLLARVEQSRVSEFG